jgi:hypothetical protein
MKKCEVEMGGNMEDREKMREWGTGSEGILDWMSEMFGDPFLARVSDLRVWWMELGFG